MGTIFLIWTMQAAVGAGLAAPILFLGRKRVGWASWHLLALILPFLVWLLLSLSPLATGRKSLANIGEPILISLAMPFAALVRVGLGRSVPDRVSAIGLITLLSVVAGIVFFSVPFIPE